MKVSLALILVLTGLFGCVDSQSKPETIYAYKHHTPSGDIHLSYRPINIEKDKTQSHTGHLETLFGVGPETGVDLSNVDEFLKITFSNFVYVKEFKFTFRVGKQLQTRKLFLNFLTPQDPDNDYFSGDDLEFGLSESVTTVVIPGDKAFFGVLRTKYVELALKDEKSNSFDRDNPLPGGSIYLTGLQVTFSDKPVFVPSLTLQEIESKYIRGRKEWEFDKWVDDGKKPDAALNKARYQIESSVMKNLIYLGLRGNMTAESDFMAYHPQESDMSEMGSMLQSWYDATKTENRRLHTP